MLIRTAVLSLGIAISCAAPAVAGGDDYDAANDTEGAGPAYFGFVRDTRGSAIADAEVILRPKQGQPVTIKSTTLGLYRSHINKDVAPDDVEVSCSKPGYKQSGVLRRPGQGSMLIETNCTLQRL